MQREATPTTTNDEEGTVGVVGESVDEIEEIRLCRTKGKATRRVRVSPREGVSGCSNKSGIRLWLLARAGGPRASVAWSHAFSMSIIYD